MTAPRGTLLALAGLLAVASLAACAVQPTARQVGDLPTTSGSASPSASPDAQPSGGSGQTTPSPGPSTSWGPAVPDPALDTYYGQQIAWSSCGGSFECGTLTVPLSYEDPSGQTVQLALLRAPAEGPDRIGSLVVNPGGPGGSGLEYARAARVIASDAVRESFDIVGFDPRGVGESDPVECLTGPQTDQFYAMDGTPDSPAEAAQVATVSKLFGERCEQRSPTQLPYVGTRDVARDLDILRAALGDEKLYYLGKSYGTFIGSAYAELFPQNVGRLVLDGVVPPDLDAEQITLGQAKAFEVALRRFVENCLTQDDCPLPAGVDAGVKRVRAFLASLEQNPLPAQPGRPLNESLGTYAILSYLYFPAYDWPELRAGLAAGFEGDGSVLMDMLDARIERQPDGQYANNNNDAFYAVSCVDRTVTGGAARAEQLSKEWAVEAPTFGPYLAWGNLPCSGWPVPATDEPHVITAPGTDPILVVTTRYDPATPYEWGVSLASQLDNAALVAYEGDGHTAYYNGSQCVDAAVDRYLLTGAVPDEDLVCR